MSLLASTTKELLNRLASWNASARQEAIEEAKQLEPDALLDLIQHLLTLLASYWNMDSHDYQKAQTALERLLPHMSCEQANALTPLQRQTLLKPLVQSLKYNNRGTQTMVYRVRIILRTLEQIGGLRELPLVEQLAAIPIRTHMNQQLQQAAIECLPYLQIRAEEQRQQTTLLRPSASGVAGDDLLRSTLPATSAAPAEQLLRAARQE